MPKLANGNAHASQPLDRILRHPVPAAVAPAGTMVLNVLVEGTTYLEMFDARGYRLLPMQTIVDSFADWRSLDDRIEDFPAPGGTIKRFRTMIAVRP